MLGLTGLSQGLELFTIFICRIHKEDIETEFQREVKKVQDTMIEVNKQADLKAQMEHFLKVC